MSDLGPGMKSYYCHECGRNFMVSNNSLDPSCGSCGSEFVEFLETQEPPAAANPTFLSSAGPQSLPSFFPSSTVPLPPSTSASVHRSAPSSAATTSTPSNPSSSTPSTHPTPTSAARGRPINVTIGANPLMRGALYNPFPPPPPPSLAPQTEHRDSPMEIEEGEDPGDEVLNTSNIRRRTSGQVRGGGQAQAGFFPGGMFMVSQSSRGGLHRPSLGEMIHQHIQDVLAQQDREEGTDGEEGSGSHPPGEQQGGRGGGSQEGGGSASVGSSSRTAGAGTGPTTSQNSNGARRPNQPTGNLRFLNFPVRVQMVRGGGGGGGQAGASAGLGAGPAGSNPQVPQFGAPMFFNLPMFGPMMGLHGSPNDYAWGPQGLENIISQMLANLEDDGPPPTDKEKLEALPTVEASPQDLRECSLCSVCKDDFNAGEELVKLPCTHLYHRDCVIPWLEMHDTCPTCRFHINTGKYDDERTSPS